ncbi:MAG TPA: DUF1385 domain-containing protein [Candidatus Limiplasma sp.]|nr:DUF1385 domain-containing protein [Candidatus Limiplasma sp.]HPS80384.1 DUF1385 domain-containing protein [Candidatus Limiplasma sp.]
MKKDKGSCAHVDIGGQAVMEGVMMKSPDAIAIAVRRPDHTIVVRRNEYVSPSKKHKWMGWPFVRGTVSFLTMLSMGMTTLQQSTDMLGILDEEPTKFELWLSKKLGKGIDKIVMATAIVLAVVLSVGLFFVLPEIFAKFLKGFWPDASMSWLVNLLSGILRILILIAYILFCAAVPDVRRTFEYHGAEHKTVYCHEHELPLTPGNAQQFSTLHPRCGTSFLLIVFVISIILFTLVGYQGNSFIWRLLSRLALLPIVAGVSFEALKGLAHSESRTARILRWPGLQMQRLTTRPPTDEMVECAIVAMNVALHGMPEHAARTPEGWAVLKGYAESDPSYQPQTEPEVPTASATETVASTAEPVPMQPLTAAPD